MFVYLGNSMQITKNSRENVSIWKAFSSEETLFSCLTEDDVIFPIPFDKSKSWQFSDEFTSALGKIMKECVDWLAKLGIFKGFISSSGCKFDDFFTDKASAKKLVEAELMFML